MEYIYKDRTHILCISYLALCCFTFLFLPKSKVKFCVLVIYLSFVTLLSWFTLSFEVFRAPLLLNILTKATSLITSIPFYSFYLRTSFEQLICGNSFALFNRCFSNVHLNFNAPKSLSIVQQVDDRFLTNFFKLSFILFN